jgi:hypothetical protein
LGPGEDLSEQNKIIFSSLSSLNINWQLGYDMTRRETFIVFAQGGETYVCRR